MVMSLFLAAVALGNLVTAGINHFIVIKDPFSQEKLVKKVSEEGLLNHPGMDGKVGTADELEKEKKTIFSPARPALLEALALVSLDENGQFTAQPEAVTAVKDHWGQSLRYETLNSKTVRIASNGPDKSAHTEWDLGVTLSLVEAPVEKKKSWLGSLVPDEPWLVKRKRELGVVEEVVDEESPYPFEVSYYAGGGTTLEGASYFWFFSGLMFFTAVGFIPYAMNYRGKTILQS